jgi:hypothetical protein
LAGGWRRRSAQLRHRRLLRLGQDGPPEEAGGGDGGVAVGWGLLVGGVGWWGLQFRGCGFFGSTGDLSLNKPVVALASSPSGGGYWLVAGDGGVFSFGDAAQVGSAVSPGLAGTVGASSSSSSSSAAGRPSLLTGMADGTVVPFGHARFCGSMYRQRLGSPIVGVALAAVG